MGSIINHRLDKKLIEEGYAAFSLTEKNELLAYIADKQELSYADITADFLLGYHKKLRISHFSNKCEEMILNGFVSVATGYTYRTNRDDQLNFIGKKLAVDSDSTISTVYWKIENTGEQVPHTRAQFLDVYQEAFKHKEGALYKLHTLRNDVKACTTHDAIFMVKW